jgi:hypothetical protein
VIATGASMYAVQRYMLKLYKWGNIDKVKNVHKPKNHLTDTDIAEDDLLTSESEVQVNKLKS